MNLMAQARELLTAYIALELLSFSLYVLAAYARDDSKSNEAGLKYIIIGAFSSALLLYGVSMVYGVLGVTKFEAIAAGLAAADAVSPSLWVGVALILVGLGFKVAAVPFHMWAPDVYEGAPYPITAYLSIGSKAAAFALVLRLAAEGFVPVGDRWEQWQLILAVLAAVTMMVGNLVALGATEPEATAGLLQHRPQRVHSRRSCGTFAGLESAFKRGDAVHSGVFGDQLRRFRWTHIVLQHDRQGDDGRPERAGRHAAVPGGGHCHRDVLAGRIAHIRRIRHQVLPVHRRG